jgi:glycosyltransferase involved in cell wall biosynthesis
MRIAYITAGAAGMYCGSCLHDNTLAAALMAKGHDVALIPTYTPTRTDEEDVSVDRVFYGAVNVYLEQKSALFRHLPGALRWLLDRPSLLNLVSGAGVSIEPRDLGGITLSMAKGEQGNQRRDLEELVAWLRDSYRPDVVHITNSMLLGLAEPLKRELGVPVLCSLQGEDIFLDELVEPYRTRVNEELRRHARAVDALVATCNYYADFMADYLAVERERVHVVRLGIKLDGHAPPGSKGRPRDAGSEARPQDLRSAALARDAGSAARQAAQPQEAGSAARQAEAAAEDLGSQSSLATPASSAGAAPFVVGYLARICPEKGLHILVDGFARLAAEVGKQRLRLHVAGYLGKRDQEYFAGIGRQIEAHGLTDVFHHAGEVSREQKIAFLQGLDVLSVPTVYRDPKGLSVLEALANGVPVVQPAHGSFPEIIEATGGGLLMEPGSPESLAAQLARLFREPDLRRRLGRAGAEAVHARFSDLDMAEATLEVYQAVGEV